VGESIPLNRGCLRPVTLTIPPGSLLAPPPHHAVAGGNVETAQRIVDVLLAAVGASAIGWTLARYAFEFDYVVSPWVFASGIGGGALAALVGGWFGLRGVLNTPPLATLREA